MVNVVRPEVAAEIAALFVAGYSIREVCRRTGRARNTVQRYRPESVTLCVCGKSSKHRGWCAWRYARSPRRQAVMRRMHAPRSMWRREMDTLRRTLVQAFMKTPHDHATQASLIQRIGVLLKAAPTEEVKKYPPRKDPEPFGPGLVGQERKRPQV